MPSIKQNQTKYKLTDISKWIKKKMIDYDMNQQDLAEILNISQSALSVKLATNRFSLEDFIVITNYFDGANDVKNLIMY